MLYNCSFCRKQIFPDVGTGPGIWCWCSACKMYTIQDGKKITRKDVIQQMQFYLLGGLLCYP